MSTLCVEAKIGSLFSLVCWIYSNQHNAHSLYVITFSSFSVKTTKLLVIIVYLPRRKRAWEILVPLCFCSCFLCVLSETCGEFPRKFVYRIVYLYCDMMARVTLLHFLSLAIPCHVSCRLILKNFLLFRLPLLMKLNYYCLCCLWSKVFILPRLKMYFRY